MQALTRRVEQGGALTFSGIAGSAQPFFAAFLQQYFPQRPIVIITENLKAQENFQQDLETWLGLGSGVWGLGKEGRAAERQTPDAKPNPLFYPAWEILPHEDKLPLADVISDRLQTLVALSENTSRITHHATVVVTNVTALLQKTFAPEDLKACMRRLNRGETISPLDLIEWLEEQAYEPEAQVTQRGEIAMRGGIVDVYPLTSPWPVRLEFFGDELESLRYFDPLTQISREEISEIIIPPAGEIGMLKQQWERGVHAASASEKKAATTSAKSAGEATMKRPVGRAPLATLLNYLPHETIFLLCEPESLAAHAETYAEQIPKGDPFFISWPDLLGESSQCGFTQIELFDDESALSPEERGKCSQLSGESAADLVVETELVASEAGSPLFASLDAFRPLAERAPEPQIAEVQRREFFQQLHRWLRQEYAVHIFCNNDGERQRFEEIWTELGLESGVLGLGKDARAGQPQTPDAKPHPQIHLGSLAHGFICDEAKIVVVTDAEIYGRYKVQRARRAKSPHANAVRSAMEIDFADLEEGDLVVHLQHGIGKFLGLKNIPATASRHASSITHQESECLVIEYAPSGDAVEPPRLFVPVSEAHLVSKYVGAGKANPPLNQLGGTRWAKAKEQTEKAVRDVAAEMLRIQAVRETQAGHACKPDTQWQREFESAFIYEETRDQLTAIAATKADQERAKPMDRLICGDVGFGKTEVAIRAAFKCVMDGKQVAILVPTTVLASQHFNNFRERMADYPIRVELLSRYRTKREQEVVIKSLADGAVDIVIGTHRLVQEDVAFKDLGLVVIDEEQRFGVLHKEKFKRLRTLVDVLTLSATPIPRTLYLALTGARDMSTIQTPPHDRLPVETIATPYDERTIRDAIKREMARGGQVFFLHNRVTTIETMRAKLASLVPDARIVVGHGQMNADDLEEVMTTFVNGDADVLLSTTIIESGLDIPNANTIIIDRADRFGLSELYQLRGRVGRYKHQAFAYLLLPRHATLLTDVRKRISAMKQYASLGSGFKIAMRDLEIRGAGNLLGSEQSGHITAVGFDLYCQLLKQSVGALKGEKVKPRVEVAVSLDFLQLSAESMAREGKSAEVTSSITHHASLPHTYVTEPLHRIEIYRKLAQANEKSALAALQKELRDRFGPLPPAAELLLAVADLKILASEKAVTAIAVEDDKLKITRRGDFVQVGGKFPRLSKKDSAARLKEIKRLLLAI
jgi:transcription-repair coupling factor (superfamily II helicase)